MSSLKSFLKFLLFHRMPVWHITENSFAHKQPNRCDVSNGNPVQILCRKPCTKSSFVRHIHIWGKKKWLDYLVGRHRFVSIWMWLLFTVCAVAMNWSLCSSYGNCLADIRNVHRCSFSERVPIVADKTTNRLNRAWVDWVRPCAHHGRFLTKSFVNESFLKLNDRLDLIEFHSDLTSVCFW